MTVNKNSSQTLSFSYRDSKGNVTERVLIHWKETSVYIQGRTEADELYRTFRKDRVIEYLKGAEHLSFDRAPPPPFLAELPTEIKGEILFTGFKSDDRVALEELAVMNGLKVVKTLTKNLAFLCAGYNAGWTKVESAVEKGAFILSQEQLIAMFNTGEICEVGN